MKPRTLKSGQKLIYTSTLGEKKTAYFVKRVPRNGATAAYILIRLPQYAGLDGPEDKGLCSLTDQEFKRSCKPA